MEGNLTTSGSSSPKTKKIRVSKKKKPVREFIHSYYMEDILINYLERNSENNDKYYLAGCSEKTYYDGHNHTTKYESYRMSPDLDFLQKESFDIPQLYNTYIPFSIIDKIIPLDMNVQYHDPTFGLPGKNIDLWDTDSANWYYDSPKLKIGDILIVHGKEITLRGDSYPFLVVNYNGEKCLLGFEASNGDYERGFCDGDCINRDGEAIHPLTGELVKIF